jgi:hypothetical protein
MGFPTSTKRTAIVLCEAGQGGDLVLDLDDPRRDKEDGERELGTYQGDGACCLWA